MSVHAVSGGGGSSCALDVQADCVLDEALAVGRGRPLGARPPPPPPSSKFISHASVWEVAVDTTASQSASQPSGASLSTTGPRHRVMLCGLSARSTCCHSYVAETSEPGYFHFGNKVFLILLLIFHISYVFLNVSLIFRYFFSHGKIALQPISCVAYMFMAKIPRTVCVCVWCM